MSHYPNDKLAKVNYDIYGGSRPYYESPGYPRRTPQVQPRSRAFQEGIYRQLSPSSRALASYKASMIQQKGTSFDFFSALVTQMRRIDEDFTLEWSDDTPLQQALGCLVQAIDVLEREKMQMGSEYYQESPGKYYENDEALRDFELSLKTREDQLKADEDLIEKEKELISIEKEKLKRRKERYRNLETEIKEQKSALELKEKEDNAKILAIKEGLESELECIESQKRALERETHEIELIKDKLDEYNSTIMAEKEEIEVERSKIFEKTLEIEREKWRLESENAILEEKVVLANHLKEKIDQEMQTIEAKRAELLRAKIDIESDTLKKSERYTNVDKEKESLREMQRALENEKLQLNQDRERLILEEERVAQILQELEEEKKKISDDQKLIEKDKQAVIEEREAIDEAWDDIEEKQGSQTGMKRIKGEEDYALVIEELQSQIANYNKEVEIREREIELKNLSLAQREEEVERKLEEIQTVEFSLLRAKRDLEELSLGTIPELENQSQHIQQILADLLLKRSEVDSGYTQLQEKINEFERSKSLSRNTGDIDRLADELEHKLRKIKEREEELGAFERELEKDKQENLSHALFLQRAQKEFEQSSAKKEAEIQENMKRLERLQKKLEGAIALINSKESELINMKDILMDEKSKMGTPDGFRPKSRTD